MVGTVPAVRRTRSFSEGFASLPRSGAGSATAGCSTEPWEINLIWLYREEGLAVRKRRARGKAVGVRVPILAEARPNVRGSLDS
jgi:hypothetical protein